VRLFIPLVPITIVVRFERRPLGPFRPRFTVRQLTVVTALLALMMGAYMTRVSLPARRQRYQRADRAIREQLALLTRAAEEDRELERSNRERLGRIVESAEKERREAAKWPAGSEERESHERLARLWDEAARSVPIGKVEESDRRARAIERRLEQLLKGWRQAEGDLEQLERFVGEAARVPDSAYWQRLGVVARLAEVKVQMQAEERAKAVREFNDRWNRRLPVSPAGTTGAMTAK
jgi:hypothetical protein